MYHMNLYYGVVLTKQQTLEIIKEQYEKNLKVYREHEDEYINVEEECFGVTVSEYEGPLPTGLELSQTEMTENKKSAIILGVHIADYSSCDFVGFNRIALPTTEQKKLLMDGLKELGLEHLTPDLLTNGCS